MQKTNNKLFVFDLDFTLWNCGGTWCDHTHPPFSQRNGYISDSQGRRLELYPDVRSILEHMKSWGVTMAVASRTGEPEWAMELIYLFDIEDFFVQLEIYPGSKLNHFKQLRNRTGYSYEEMVFFDDENINIQEVSTLGVNAVPVPEGLQWELLP